MRHAVFFLVGFLLALAVGAARGTWMLGAVAGVFLGSGLLLTSGAVHAFRRRGARSPLAFLVGLVALVVGVALFVPRVAYVARFIAPLSVVDEGDFIRVLTDKSDPAFDAALARARQNYERAFVDLLGERAKECTVDIVVAHEASTKTAFGLAGEGMGEFGSYREPVLGRAVVVAPRGTGWGSVTHHAMYRLASCALQTRRAFVLVGLASLVEKHTIDETKGAFVLSHRSDWRPLDVSLSSEKKNLMKELDRADDQAFLRSFFLFMNEEGFLRPMLKSMASGKSPIGALAEATTLKPHEIEMGWRVWLTTKAKDLPVLMAASPFEGAPDL